MTGDGWGRAGEVLLYVMKIFCNYSHYVCTSLGILLKTTEMYTLKEQILWCVNYISKIYNEKLYAENQLTFDNKLSPRNFFCFKYLEIILVVQLFTAPQKPVEEVKSTLTIFLC